MTGHKYHTACCDLLKLNGRLISQDNPKKTKANNNKSMQLIKIIYIYNPHKLISSYFDSSIPHFVFHLMFIGSTGSLTHAFHFSRVIHKKHKVKYQI